MCFHGKSLFNDCCSVRSYTRTYSISKVPLHFLLFTLCYLLRAFQLFHRPRNRHHMRDCLNHANWNTYFGTSKSFLHSKTLSSLTSKFHVQERYRPSRGVNFCPLTSPIIRAPEVTACNPKISSKFIIYNT
jgi:hypothetical protein